MEAWINGEASARLEASDRGLHYGDGLFETMAVVNGRVRLLTRHLARLSAGCARLALPALDLTELREEIEAAAAGRRRCVLKLIVTRGSGGRGYAPPRRPALARLLLRYRWPEYPPANAQHGINVHICETRLGRNPSLAGLKHLNRLENVLARAEWTEEDGYQEGLMRDEADRVIEGTMSNVFAVVDETLVTPALDAAGVAGIMRGVLLEAAAAKGVATRIANLTLPELVKMNELFVCNSLIGVWPITALGAATFPVGELTRRAARWAARAACVD